MQLTQRLCGRPRVWQAAAAVSRRPMSVATSATAKIGDAVEVHYTGKLDNGEVFDSSVGKEPLAFTIGAGQVVKGFDAAVTGLAEGEKRTYRMEPADAYGERDPNAIIQLPNQAGTGSLKEGVRVGLSNGMSATVVKITPEQIILDVNHELAGKALTFDVELVKLIEASKLETAYFGAGCFWSVELIYQRTPGVIRTAVGYCNGDKPNPTYEDVCSGATGHAEVVEVVYNTDQVSFSDLCDVFWGKHDPTTPNRQGNDVGSQYRSGIYYTKPEQKEAALESIKRAQPNFSSPIVTEVDEVKLWTPAEEYHQQYLAKGGRFGQPQSAKKGCTDPIRCYG